MIHMICAITLYLGLTLGEAEREARVREKCSEVVQQQRYEAFGAIGVFCRPSGYRPAGGGGVFEGQELKGRVKDEGLGRALK